MSQEQTYVALYAIGKHPAGAKLKLDPEGKEAKRLLNAKAIATPEELAKKYPHAKTDGQADEKVAELEKALEEKDAELKAAEEKAKAADEKVAELEKALEEASKPATGKAAK